MSDEGAGDGVADAPEAKSGASAPGAAAPDARIPASGWAGVATRWRALARRLDLSTAALAAVVGVTAAGLLARLAWLDARGAHFDEGRVAYWALRYAETGHFEYRPIVHGPLLQHVDRWLFAVLGPNDLVARLPVALVGGLLPLAALLFRDHLRDREVAAMALFLAADPVLLYYSRFARSDVLVAAFSLATLGWLLRLLATRRPRYLHAAAASGALAFASKENAAVYALCWLGAGALVVDTGLFRPRDHPSGAARLRERARSIRDAVAQDARGVLGRTGRWAGHLGLAVGLGLFVTLFLFAPRAGSVGGPGLWRALVDPLGLPELAAVTAADVAGGFGYWFGGAGEPGCHESTLVDGYACYLWRMTRTVGAFALPLVALAVVGFLQDRYAVARSRPLVQFATYWGAASFLGYPLATDIWAAWLAVHVVVPLSIPAAVGLGLVVAVGRPGLGAAHDLLAGRPADAGGLVRVAVAVLLVAGVLAVQGGVGARHAYLDHSGRQSSADMVQYAQPSPGVRPAVEAMRTAVAGNDGGPDVLYYGARFYLADESAVAQPPPADPANGTGSWFDRLPLPWYTEAAGADVASVREADALAAALADRPPVVVADAARAGDVAERVDGYRRFGFDLRAQTGPTRATEVVVFVDGERL